MTTITVEQRLETLETRLDAVQRELTEGLRQAGQQKNQGWQSIVGTFANDPLYDDAMLLARQWRKAQHDELAEDTN